MRARRYRANSPQWNAYIAQRAFELREEEAAERAKTKPVTLAEVPEDERTGMIRCEPMLHSTMNSSIAPQCVPHAARPSIPTPIRAAAAAAM